MALDWADFFQFSVNDTFEIKENDSMLENLTGTGKVLSVSKEVLQLELNIPQQTIGLKGFLANFLLGINSVDVPEIIGKVVITLVDEGENNKLEVSGTYKDSSGIPQSFSYTDSDLEAKLIDGDKRIRLDASKDFLRAISSNRNIDRLGRLEFQKTSDPKIQEMDVADLLGDDKIEVFFERT